MKTLATLAAVIAGAVLVALPLHSQAPAPGIPAGTPLEQLKAMREINAKLLDQQAATLQKLDELSKEAEQLKIFARRS